MHAQMKKQDGKSNLTIGTIIFTLLFPLFISSLWAMDEKLADIMHPMMKPKAYTSNTLCPNCGMVLNMWARTRHTFANSEGNHETCSIRCLSDMSQKIGEEPKDVKVALYLEPDTMIDADEAFYVVGSSAKGTMTMKSKIAFGTKEKADDFTRQNGGEIKSFSETKEIAAVEVNQTRSNIQTNRLEKGKIVMAEDKDSCAVCGMPPAKYPNNRAQVSTEGGKHLHFCSTKCLINYIDEPEKQTSDAEKTKDIWVTVSDEGDYEYANALYYVVGSDVNGPMGPEAFPFRKKSDAAAFASKEGGKVVLWKELTPELVMGSAPMMEMGH